MKQVKKREQEAKIGTVPNSWSVKPLESFLELITYGFTNPMPTTEKGPFRITATNIEGGKIDYKNANHTTVDAYENDLTDKSRPKINDVLLTKDGSIGRCAVVDRPNICINQSVALLRTNKKILPTFLSYMLQAPYYQRRMAQDAGGSTIKHIYITRVDKMEVAVPRLDKQKQIVSILSAFDDLIKNNTRRIEILEEMARRIYREWFVHYRYPGHEDDDPSTSTSAGSEHRSGQRLVDSGTDEFDKVPESWNMQVMDEILEHYIGGTWGKEEPEDEKNNPAYVIRGTDIPGGRSGNVDDIPLRYHKQSYINSRKLQHGDIVFEVSGGSKDQPVGRAMLITDTFLTELNCEDVVHASFCKLLRSDKSILKPEILYLHIREIYDDRRIMKYQVQSTGISNFKFTFFAENKQMFIPPKELQEKFQEKVSPLFKQMYILGKQINRLKETRDLLLPKFISGDIENKRELSHASKENR